MKCCDGILRHNDHGSDKTSHSWLRAGGKLLVAQGGTNAAEIPGAIFDYYETVDRAMGSRPATMDFFRLARTRKATIAGGPGGQRSS